VLIATWILVLVATTRSDTVAITTVPGYESKDACESAAGGVIGMSNLFLVEAHCILGPSKTVR
jgi:hypothetical protein